jgi:hypothetical protein
MVVSKYNALQVEKILRDDGTPAVSAATAAAEHITTRTVAENQSFLTVIHHVFDIQL